MLDFVVVGAGISGSLCAKRLVQAGLEGLVLEKARGPGGRMSTRRVEEEGQEKFRFDHGAQFFTQRDDLFAPIVESWLEHGLIKKAWEDIPHQNYESSKTEERYISPEGMSRLVKDTLQGVEVRYQMRIDQIDKKEDGAYELKTEEGAVISSRFVIVSAPLPQARTLLPWLTTELPDISFDLCVAVLFGSDDDWGLKEPGALWPKESSGIAWVANNFSKGVSARPALTVHLNPRLSRAMYEKEDEDIIDETKQDLAELGVKFSSTIYQAVHRWRYSQSHEPRKNPPYFREDSLFVVGDALGGGRVEGAAVSGLSAAEALVRVRS